MDRDPLLEERGKTHGNFGHNAQVSQGLKTVVRDKASPLSDIHKECLDLIFTKISRISSGKADFPDHWDDIAGYAKLASEACRK